MGKKKRLNRFITKWIKSDLPDDRSTVLLLGVTTIPTTPTAARRPCSLPLGTTPNCVPQNNPIVQHKSRKHLQSRRNTLQRQNSLRSNTLLIKNTIPAECSQTEIQKVHRHILESQQSVTLSSSETNSSSSEKRCSASSDDLTPTNTLTNSSDFTPGPTMDRSVDSIGACSLDADVSIDLTDCSEQSSVGTLRSLSIPTPEPQPYLPSYLSLACTVSGYSTTTNYDPDRLSRSRDASPHRRHDDASSPSPLTYQIRNNLLSPPNVVPLPHHKYTPIVGSHTNKDMEEQIETRREVYTQSSRISTTFTSQESKTFINSMFCNDAVDGCVKNGHPSEAQTRYVSFETKHSNYLSNGSGKSMSESSYKEFSNGIQQKSFIQQRVERLYGPGALAQGFFISKRQKNRLSESESDNKSNLKTSNEDKHSKSMSDKLFDNDLSESSIKQSTSSPTLPVLRHLRPEFRAQLPIISSKKSTDSTLHKSVTVPSLNEEQKVNGHSAVPTTDETIVNGTASAELQNETVKDGHYFLRILEAESSRLLQMASKVEQDLETENMSEEIKGKLRSASGKARLLTSQKMQQFKGLCANNLTQKSGEEFPTTNEDLQGFWDMVLLQVEQIDQLFKEIDVLRANHWIESAVPKKSISNGINVGKPRKVVRVASKTSNVNTEANKEREAKRKQMLEERRKAMRQQKQNMNENIEIFVPESS